MPLDDHDRLETLKHLHTLHSERFYRRREWEWRVAFTFWGGLAVSANALRGASGIPICAYTLALLAAVGLHLYFEAKWVFPQASANRKLGIEINNEINEMIGRASWDDPSEYNRIANYWQVAVTALLGLFVGAAIYWG